MGKRTGKPTGRPSKITTDLIDKISDCFLVAFTDEQTALYCGIDRKTVYRMRVAGFCPAVKIAELKKEMIYRQKVWNATGFWQGAAWFLERKYPTQFSRPEIQLAINTQVTNNTAIVITTQQLGKVNERIVQAEGKLVDYFDQKSNGNGNSHAQTASE
jgi:hypothetical protein